MIDESDSTSSVVAEPATGRLGPLTFPSLVHDICEEKSTGVLTLGDGGREKSVYIEQGRIVFARSNATDDRLSSLLIRQGRITLKQMDEGSRLSEETGQRFGGALVQRNIIRPQDLVMAVREQVKEIVVSLFLWTTGTYEMSCQPLPSKEVITLKMGTSDMILEGVKRVQSWSRIQLAIGGAEATYQVSPRLDELASAMTLSLEEWTLLSRCEGPVALEHLCKTTPLKDFEVCRLVWGFTVVGLLKRKD